VVAKLDRLSRSMLDFAPLIATAQKQHWTLVAWTVLSTPRRPPGSDGAHPGDLRAVRATADRPADERGAPHQEGSRGPARPTAGSSPVSRGPHAAATCSRQVARAPSPTASPTTGCRRPRVARSGTRRRCGTFSSGCFSGCAGGSNPPCPRSLEIVWGLVWEAATRRSSLRAARHSARMTSTTTRQDSPNRTVDTSDLERGLQADCGSQLFQRQCARGESLRAIADDLNEGGVPTAQDGAPWYAATVRHVLLRTS